jgi:hypothetical protein
METNETNPQEEIQPSFSEPEPEPVRSSTLVCPHCQQEHAIGTLFCPATGKSLSAEPVIEELPQVQEVPAPTPSQGYVPQPPPTSNSNQPPYYPPPAYAAPRPSKDRNIALVLEILPGLFGILGIGWIYSGKVGTGIAWLIGYLIWVGIAVTVSILTGFIACFCTVPINLICVGISAYALNSYTKNNPQIFG